MHMVTSSPRCCSEQRHVGVRTYDRWIDGFDVCVMEQENTWQRATTRGRPIDPSVRPWIISSGTILAAAGIFCF
jgi:hypothetical protein